MTTSSDEKTYDVIVIGAGAAGVGVSVALTHAGIENFIVLDKHYVGASFANWPAETRFITPSFPTNSIGMLDLNSIAVGVSPAYSLGVEHPTGKQYAAHLQGVAQFYEIPVQPETDVLRFRKLAMISGSIHRKKPCAPNTSFGLRESFSIRGLMASKAAIFAATQRPYPNTKRSKAMTSWLLAAMKAASMRLTIFQDTAGEFACLIDSAHGKMIAPIQVSLFRLIRFKGCGRSLSKRESICFQTLQSPRSRKKAIPTRCIPATAGDFKPKPRHCWLAVFLVATKWFRISSRCVKTVFHY